MIKARESANMRFIVRNKRTQDIEPETTRKPLPKKIYDLFNNPNVLQSRWEFLQQRKVLEQVCGNSFTYANCPIGFKTNIENVQSLFNVWPQYMQFILAGSYFEATKIEEVIKSWKFEYGTYKKTFEPHEILHRNQPNTNIGNGLIFGSPIAQALVKPLSNIDMAYESRNVLMANRGMRAIFSSDRGDDSGKIPLFPEETKEVYASLKKFGTMEGQENFWFTNYPISVTPIDQDVTKLGLFEEIATDAMLVCHAFGVPEILLKLYLQGATFENQSESVKRLYSGTLIPEAEDDLIAFNRFLGLNDTEWVLEGSFDHVPGLQRAEADRSKSNREASVYLKDLFLCGAITHNQWLEGVELEPYTDGDKRIWEFDDRQIGIILNKLTVQSESQQNGNQENNNPPPPKPKMNGHNVNGHANIYSN